MPRVEVLSKKISFEVKSGKNILSAAQKAGVPWRKFCGASGFCGTCSMLVVSGELPPPEPLEENFINGWARNPGFRLACQAKMGESDLNVICCSDEEFDPDRLAAAYNAACAPERK
jgi:ferredoxin